MPSKAHAGRREAQIAEAEQFATCLPSDASVRSAWIFASRGGEGGFYPTDCERSGKWLIFATQETVDSLWAQIKAFVKAGKMGNLAKVASARHARKDRKSGMRTQVICVYTYDWTDHEDVTRVRDRLRELGVTWRIGYKADADTEAGRYAHKSHARVCKFWA
jgi:hypothetical protein